MTTESNSEPDESDPADKSTEQRVISRVWRRLRAFLLDTCMLIAVCSVASGPGATMTVGGRTFRFGPFWSLGQWERLLQFCVTLVYFGVLNSSIAGGQTIFKRVMKIQSLIVPATPSPRLDPSSDL